MKASPLSDRISPLTRVLFLLGVVALGLYLFYPAPLYHFHKQLLNILTPGLSLIKPLLFFWFLFLCSLAKDLFRVEKPGFRDWSTLQVGLLACILALGAIGVVVFANNIQHYNAAFDGDDVDPRQGAIFYISYEGETLFFYTISNTAHLHENKALAFPVARYLGLEGDVGEAVYPFYPLPLLILAYALLVLTLWLMLESVRRIATPTRGATAVLVVFFSLVYWRLLHVTIDGGLLNWHLFVSVMLLLFGIALYAYVRRPTSASSLVWVCGLIVATPLVLRLLSFLLKRFGGLPVSITGEVLVLVVAEQLLVFALVTLLLRRGRLSLSLLRKTQGIALAYVLTAALIVFYVYSLLSMDVRTALDPTESYAVSRSQTIRYLVATSATPANPCNMSPVQEFHISRANVLIFNNSKGLHCSSEYSWYWYPLSGNDAKDAARLIVDCRDARIPITRDGDVCSAVLHKRYSFFLFSAASDLRGEQVYYAYRRQD